MCALHCHRKTLGRSGAFHGKSPQRSLGGWTARCFDDFNWRVGATSVGGRETWREAQGGAFLIVLVGALAGAPMPSAQAQSTVGPLNAGPASAASSNNASTGGNDSAAGIAAEQGQAVNPVGTPGTLPVANGVALTFTYIGEAAGNPTGGIKQGAAYSEQIFGGLDFDLKTIVGLDGGFVHFAMVERNGQSDSASFIGNDTAVQEIYGQQKLRLTLFTYQQKFLDGKIDITLGRSGGNDDFLTSPLYCLFESNAICGSPVYIFQTTNFTAFPASGYAGIGKIFLTDKVYLHVGAYAADPENTAPTEIGYNLGSRRRRARRSRPRSSTRRASPTTGSLAITRSARSTMPRSAPTPISPPTACPRR